MVGTNRFQYFIFWFSSKDWIAMTWVLRNIWVSSLKHENITSNNARIQYIYPESAHQTCEGKGRIWGCEWYQTITQVVTPAVMVILSAWADAVDNSFGVVIALSFWPYEHGLESNPILMRSHHRWMLNVMHQEEGPRSPLFQCTMHWEDMPSFICHLHTR